MVKWPKFFTKKIREKNESYPTHIWFLREEKLSWDENENSEV